MDMYEYWTSEPKFTEEVVREIEARYSTGGDLTPLFKELLAMNVRNLIDELLLKKPKGFEVQIQQLLDVQNL